ncbi:hypothetical protein ARMGADRAFT_1012754 [Armillaria gallica]|uniref:Uncharacterized protein n=1 Tax=Armillaria gallica TaxID=47427 RepID=A0A2H3DQD4_ARMGA|nr:hypothetical protein ARMGADRAFT_1012754 [Armillaria gallica]
MGGRFDCDGIVSSHIAHVSLTLTIITLDGSTIFSNVHIGKVWCPYDRLKPSVEDVLNHLIEEKIPFTTKISTRLRYDELLDKKRRADAIYKQDYNEWRDFKAFLV